MNQRRETNGRLPSHRRSPNLALDPGIFVCEETVLRLRALFAAAVAATVAVGIVPGVAQAAATTPMAIWEMNEASGATTMTDSSGNGLNGRVGTEVVTGVTVSGSNRGYRFARLKPNTPPAHPEHLVTVPDNAKLDPGTRDFAVTVRFRTTDSFGNLIQKGQSGASGGYWKIQLPKGKAQCLFRGSSGSRALGSPTALNDGAYHTIRCERVGNTVTMYVDGVRVRRITGPTGNINNTWAMSIAGKTYCDQIEVTCDYFPGIVDRVQIDSV